MDEASSTYPRGQLDKQGTVVVLCTGIEGGAVAAYLSAFLTPVNNDKAVLGVGLGADGAHDTAALVGAVTGIYINVERTKTEGTVIA